MRFSCARCGQRYASVDEPEAGHEYRVPCVACGAVLLLKGGGFPALPTAGPDPGAAAGSAAVSDATGEEPLGLALGPMVVPQRAALSHGETTRGVRREGARPSRHWLRVATGGGVALATVGAVLLLVLGGPSDARLPASASPPAVPPVASAQGPGTATAGPVAPAPPAPAPAWPGAVPTRASLPPAAAAPVPASSGRRGPQPPAPRVASLPAASPPASPVARVAATPAAPAGGGRTPSPAPSSRPPSERMVAESLAGRRPAFDACVRDWLRANPGTGLSGHRVTVTLIVSPNGTVGASSIDDPGLESSTLGTCLRDVLGRPFPAFEGDPLQVVVPLRLGE